MLWFWRQQRFDVAKATQVSLQHFLEGTDPVPVILLRCLMVSLGGPGLSQLIYSQEHWENKVHLHLTENTHGGGRTTLTTEVHS